MAPATKTAKEDLPKGKKRRNAAPEQKEKKGGKAGPKKDPRAL